MKHNIQHTPKASSLYTCTHLACAKESLSECCILILDCMLTLSELFPQLPPKTQGKPFLPFQLCLPSGNLLQTSELLAVCSCSLKIFSSILQDAEWSWEKPVVLHSLPTCLSARWRHSAPVVSDHFCELLFSWIDWIWNTWHCEWQILSSTSCLQAVDCIHEMLSLK